MTKADLTDLAMRILAHPSGIIKRMCKMGFIKNEYPISEKGEVVFTDKKPRNLEDTLDNVVLGNVLSFIADLLKNGRNSTVYELKSGALVRWDLNIEDMRPSQDKIVVNAKYWLERPGGVPKYSSDFSDVFNFSGLQLTGSELTSGRVKIIAECNNESDFIRKRFDEIWADVLKTFKTSVQPAPDIIKNSKASQIMEFVKQNPDALSGLVLGKTTMDIINGQPAPTVDEGMPEKTKQKGRYRLTREEINKRKKIVIEANKLKKENPRMYWKQIAEQLEIPERTLRDYRHQYYANKK